MPQYIFKCKKCDGLFEEQHPMSEAPSQGKCPACDNICERYYGDAPAVIFKGHGWPSKNIKRGVPAISENPFEAEDTNRKKKGLKPSKEVKMSDEEFKKRKKQNQDWIDSVKKK